jgi:FixJ family two-component response regulator
MKTHGLTDTENTVAAHIANHRTVKQIAFLMGEISQQAVHQHIDHIVIRWHLDPQLSAMTQIAEQYRRATATAA